jgi:hypothetical protein
MSSESNASLGRLILVPSLVTLAVTLLRLAGEWMRWSPALFNRDAGGGGALVGIVWLIPVFGAWFGLRLSRAGEAPPRLGPAFKWAGLALAFTVVLAAASIALFPRSPVVQLGLFAVISLGAVAIARRGWPGLWRVLLAYGVAARVPVLAIMFPAIFLGWDTHYAKPRPDFPPMGPWGVFFWTAVLPQLAIWIFVTVVLGLLSGAAAVGIQRRMRPEPSEAATLGAA